MNSYICISLVLKICFVSRDTTRISWCIHPGITSTESLQLAQPCPPIFPSLLLRNSPNFHMRAPRIRDLLDQHQIPPTSYHRQASHFSPVPPNKLPQRPVHSVDVSDIGVE